MGGDKAFVNQLQKVFDNNQYDMANEPDIGYPYLFNYVKGEEWRTQKTVSNLLKTYYKNSPDGLPGNDDTGTMSAWAVFSMMGIYPVSPADTKYAITTPLFDRITIKLNKDYYSSKKLTILKEGDSNGTIDKIFLNDTALNGYFIQHDSLLNSETLKIRLKN